MKTVGKDDFLKEKQEALEWTLNPVKVTVLELLQSDLNEENYRKLTKEDVINIIKQKFEEKGFYAVGKESVQAGRVVNKLKKTKTRDEAILALGDYILQ